MSNSSKTDIIAKAMDITARSIDLLAVVGKITEEKLALDMVVKKVVESTWLHIANAGLIGREDECPRLPDEFSWACKAGHNMQGYPFAKLIAKISNSSNETIIQSKHILTDVVLWMIWHYQGRFRVIVSGSVVYDCVLGPEQTNAECRVAKFCAKDRNQCSRPQDGQLGVVKVFETIAGSLHLYPKLHKSTQNRTRGTAREILRWLMKLPVKTESTADMLALNFHLNLAGESNPPHCVLRVGDLFGQSPRLLNMDWGGCDEAVVAVVFKDMGPKDGSPAHLGEPEDEYMDTQYWINLVLDFFPILRDLTDRLHKTCECYHCGSMPSLGDPSGVPNLLHDDSNCLAYLACHEVIFYFSHAIADAFGFPDASGSKFLHRDLEGPLGGLDILLDLISRHSEGRSLICWHSMLNTASRVFLGADSPPALADDYRNMESCMLPGETDGRGVNGGSEACIIETQRTEDVTNFNARCPPGIFETGDTLCFQVAKCEEKWDWVLVPVDLIRKKLLLRVMSGNHSRMVEPSRAIQQLLRISKIPACTHTPDTQGVVPKGAVLEMHSFDELLRRWGDEDTDDESEFGSEVGEDNSPELPDPKRQKMDRPRLPSKRPIHLRACHTL
ncbi:hypothetical protein B0T10DRAFT_601170 [Thelonectria olida]|uniref:Uncharacterized protein n=1 Tax=Thelonectria olida TaxID=1576542 RepID=A0A9P9ASC8_9HYPO|nr:hypothetical protein B0T10DRAFT_601170 [Thelonectria olida]